MTIPILGNSVVNSMQGNSRNTMHNRTIYLTRYDGIIDHTSQLIQIQALPFPMPKPKLFPTPLDTENVSF